MTQLRFDANLKWLFTELPFEQRFDAAAGAGFTAVEIPSPYDFPATEIRRRLDEAGLTPVLINTPTGSPGSVGRSGFGCVPDQVVAFREGLERGLEYAVTLGAPLLHVMAGSVPSGVDRDRAFAQFVVNVAWAAERATRAGVQLVLEAQNSIDSPGYLLQTQAQSAAVAQAVGAGSVGLLLDFYHVQVSEGNLLHTVERFRHHVRHIQIADPPLRSEPGSGEIGWTAVFAAIRDSGYPGWIGCEYRPRAGTVEGLGWINQWHASR